MRGSRPTTQRLPYSGRAARPAASASRATHTANFDILRIACTLAPSKASPIARTSQAFQQSMPLSMATPQRGPKPTEAVSPLR
jgi:hypothetical protein